MSTLFQKLSFHILSRFISSGLKTIRLYKEVDPIKRLPRCICEQFILYLEIRQFPTCAAVSKEWARIFKNDNLWLRAIFDIWAFSPKQWKLHYNLYTPEPDIDPREILRILKSRWIGGSIFQAYNLLFIPNLSFDDLIYLSAHPIKGYSSVVKTIITCQADVKPGWYLVRKPQIIRYNKWNDYILFDMHTKEPDYYEHPVLCERDIPQRYEYILDDESQIPTPLQAAIYQLTQFVRTNGKCHPICHKYNKCSNRGSIITHYGIADINDGLDMAAELKYSKCVIVTIKPLKIANK